MHFRLPSRSEYEYILIIVTPSYKVPLTIYVEIRSWQKTTGNLRWATEDGKGYHESVCWPRWYENGKMNWFPDDGKGKSGVPIYVVGFIDKLCNKIERLKAFL